MTIMAWLQYNWTDYKLVWDPKKYGGITDIRFSGADSAPAKLWKPDILLFNSVAESFSSTYSSNFVVKHTGEVNQVPPGIFKFTCDIDITWFPFDDQLCFLKFGSWTHPGNIIDLDMDLATVETVINGTKVPSIPIRNEGDPQNYFVYDSVDRSDYIDNGEWSLLRVAYHELFFYIRIQRRTLAYGINLIIPSLLISLMTVLGFTLPPDACEKITLGILNMQFPDTPCLRLM
ncbi:unnamed protein product [Enterobius vermicularis]|uniref:Neur_chan_LBD domain-containing protein n=1 Tax=Enterobius vermicularis TaxID=51028 RepID=A0A0N4VQ10_ENTVE|nr:unnamed protein product [Enterobius vermicularis]